MVALSFSKNKILNRFMGISSFIAALLISFADFILEFNIEYGVSSSIVERAWAQMPEWRFILSLNVCAFLIPFYILGFWLLYKALQRNNHIIAVIVFVFFSYGVIMGSPLIHGVMSLNGIIYKYGIVNGLSHEFLACLIEGKITSAILPVFLFHYLVTWIIAPSILFVHIIRGKSIFNRWTAFLNPLVFLIIGFVGLEIFPSLFIYLTPGAINKGNAALFLLLVVKMWNEQ